MNDEPPRDKSPGDDAPADAPVAAEEPTAPADVPPPPPPPPDEAPAQRGFSVPKWAAAGAAAVVLLFGGGFAIGHATAGGDGDEGREQSSEQESPEREDRGEDPDQGREDGDEARPTSSVFLGVATGDASGDQQGAEILRVANGSPAEDAGLQDGDIVTAVDGSAVASSSDLAREVREHEPGDRVTITYSRDGNSAQAEVTLGDREEAETPSA
jgi:membrane-associated protease RseP (regulator of RpoE activity)